MRMTPPLVLASTSKTRLALLAKMGYRPDLVAPQDVDETPLPRELPRPYVKRVALLKMEKAREASPGAVILAADTVIAVGRRIIQRAFNADECRSILKLLSGRRHRVLTAVYVFDPERRRINHKITVSIVHMKRLSNQELNFFVDTQQWQGVAGYKINEFAGSLIPRINGSVSSIQGLPMLETRLLLEGAGLYPDLNLCAPALAIGD